MGEHDLGYVLAWRNHSDVRKFMLTQHEITDTEHRAWFERTSKDKTRALLVVEDHQQPIGCVIFSRVEKNSTADWSFYSAPASRAGTGKLVCSAALDFAFQELGVHKVAGQVLDFNIASIRLHQRLGFTQEGILREHGFIDKKYHDLLCFGLLSNEWLGFVKDRP
ncbi:UDP-4-amino-4,6-dideoxy-N-acetyl-beta-L-altrosamine N-acetyltransferase [Pseudomonas sp. GD03909]|nr:UDP-4-amino-4,6-dideoxy-N-acetyl-beta-L-altrosamine N-acetyltransferase [Pseudomonas sp. GD03909]